MRSINEDFWLVKKGAGEARWWRPCDPSTLEAEACPSPSAEAGSRERKLPSALRFCLFTFKSMDFSFRGCNDNLCLSWIFSLAIIQRYWGVMFASKPQVSGILSVLGILRGHRSCNVTTAFIPDPWYAIPHLSWSQAVFSCLWLHFFFLECFIPILYLPDLDFPDTCSPHPHPVGPL